MAAIGSVAGLVLVGVSGLLVAACVAVLIQGAAGVGVGLAVALLLCVVVPALLERRLTRALRRLQPGARGMFFQTLGVVNALWLALLVLLAPRYARSALETRGPAFVPGASAGTRGWFTRVASFIPRSDAPAPSSAALLASPKSAVSSPDTPAAAVPVPSASVAPAPAPLAIREAPEADAETPAAKVYREHASSVVVIHAHTAVPTSGPLAMLYDRLGVTEGNSLGSGFIIAEDGLIVTNHHVIDGATSLQIVTKDGTHFDDVSVLRDEPRNDLALLSVAGKGLPAVSLSTSKDITIGSSAIAIGSPLGFEYTLTEGIVSAHRNVDGTRFLQMQTAVAPGSSGGPLFDRRGSVIGVNTATGGAAGLNLAVHVAEVKKLLEAPRSAKALAHFAASPRMASLETEGPELDPTTRLSLRDTAPLLGGIAQKCAKPLGDGAEVTVDLPTELLGKLTISSSLGSEVEACLTMSLRLVGMQIAMLLMKVEHAPSAIHVTIADLRREDGSLGQLVYHFKRGS